MPPSITSGKTGRARRREEFWNLVTHVVGCLAIIGLIAAVVAVAWQQVMRSAPVVDEAYAHSSSHDSVPSQSWSGRTQSEPAQFDVMRTAAVRPDTGQATPSQEAAKITGRAAASLPKAETLASGIEDIESKRDKISERAQAFFAARTVEGKLPYVRDPERVKPLMEEFYAREAMPEMAWRELGRAVRVEEPGFRFGYVQALFDNATSVTLIVEERKDGEFRLDWECLVRYGEQAWADFLRLRPQEPKLMRVKASRAATAEPGDSLSERLELRHSIDSGTLLASFRRDDPGLAPLLAQLNQGNWKDVPLTLRLHFPRALEGPSVGSMAVITGVEGKGWLILDGTARP
ncbi:MAG: hypothetical protein JWO94_823 [Verrucomicrobiaceae bacterium]|nr:hypothetical protein [Verrucomicrobiaceae bacterium]